MFVAFPRGVEPRSSASKAAILPLDEGKWLATGEGVEPPFAESESAVVPLDHPASSCEDQRWRKGDLGS